MDTEGDKVPAIEWREPRLPVECASPRCGNLQEGDAERLLKGGAPVLGEVRSLRESPALAVLNICRELVQNFPLRGLRLLLASPLHFERIEFRAPLFWRELPRHEPLLPLRTPREGGEIALVRSVEILCSRKLSGSFYVLFSLMFLINRRADISRIEP